MTLFEKIIFLSHVDLFHKLPVEDLELVASIAEVIESGADTVLFREGDAGDRMYLVVSGQVALLKDGPSGPFQVATRSDREFFGEMALLDDDRRSASAQCISHCQFLVLNKEDFVQLVLEYPVMALAIFKYLCGLIRKK